MLLYYHENIYIFWIVGLLKIVHVLQSLRELSPLLYDTQLRSLPETDGSSPTHPLKALIIFYPPTPPP